MKIVKHTARDMRQALRLVREQLGPDAVILQSRRSKGGVEVTAAIDFDAEQFAAQTAAPDGVRPLRPQELTPPAPEPEQSDPYAIADEQLSTFARVRAAVEAETAARRAPAPKPVAAVVEPRPQATRPAADARARTELERHLAARTSQLAGEAADRAAEAEIEAYIAAAEAPRSLVLDSAAPQPVSVSHGREEMGTELRSLRRILETQLASLAWNDLTRRAPIHTEILRELTEVGLTPDFAAQIVAQLPAGADLTLARRHSIALIAQRLPVTGDRWLDKGGCVALVGPTGVGKTTALAKLAVRWVLRHGARSLALISADSVRIGAHDQIQALGQMLDVRVYTAESFADLPHLIDSLAHTRFVLIDTMGSSQRDVQLTSRLQQLAAAGSKLETALVLSASTQAGAIEETVTRFATANVSSCLLTKVDEAASIGGVLSVLTRAELPISYVSEGQRVPEDLRPARALELVSRAVQLAKTSGAAADEDLLRRRYGDVAHALA
jgi:flagellar biosynthesis protein FlhF